MMDAIQLGCYQDMVKCIKKREDFFQKEIGGMRKKEATLLKSLEKYTAPPEEKKEASAPKITKKMTREQRKAYEAEQARLAKEAAERKAKEEEEARLRAEAEEAERKRKEEEEAKNKKGGKKPTKGAADADDATPVIETEDQRKEREKAELQKQLEELRALICAYQGKVKLCQENAVKVSREADVSKVCELMERTGERKYMNNSAEEPAHSILRERKAYTFAQVVKGGEDGEEQQCVPIEIDGACIRTPDEDLVWAEQ